MHTRSLLTLAAIAWFPLAQGTADTPDGFERDGLKADRKTQRIEFFAETTGIGVNEPLEFFLIGGESGNAYEAFAVALAEPRDIYDAMLFIGIAPGRGVNPDKLQFWPKGERVVMTLDGHQAETFILNDETGKNLEPNGLVFIGSQFIPPMDGSEGEVLAAQERGPYSIAANYNEMDSLFDVPFSAPQAAVYTRQSLNPDRIYPKGKRIQVVIEPEYKDGKQRVTELTLHVGGSTPPSSSLTAARLTVRDADGTVLTDKPSLPKALSLFSRLNDDGHDPFVTLDFGEDATVGQLHQLAQLLQTIDGEKGVRVEPPLQGQPYYKAFAPNEAYRTRENRFLQPWELRLEPSTNGTVTATATEITETWTKGEPKPAISTEEHAIDSPEAFVQLITSRKPDVKVLLVYAPETLTYAELMAFVRPVQATHPIVHVYLESRDSTR